MDDAGADLARTPLAYPGAPVAGPRLVVGDCAHILRPGRSGSLGGARTRGCALCDPTAGRGAHSLDRMLDRLGAAPLAQRTPVLAIGSNAAAEVLQRKLGTRAVGVVLPLLTGVVRNLGVGHTAYVSRGGYVPAAPLHLPRARTAVVLELLDDHQLAALDATEPGYDRVELGATRYPLVLSGGLRPNRFHVYASKGGVLALPGRRRGLLPQHEVLSALRDAGIPHTDDRPAAVAAGFAASALVRAEVREALAARGLVQDAGLVHRPAGILRWTEVLATPRRRGHGPVPLP